MKKSLEEFVHQSGQWIGRLKQSALQTGKPKGTYKRWDEHPFVEGLVLECLKSEWGERWVTRKQQKRRIETEAFRGKNPSAAAKQNAQEAEILASKITYIKKSIDDFVYKSGKSVGRLMQSELQTGNPKGTFKRWDEHPSVEDLVFNKWNTKKGEVWSQLEDLQKMEANKKAYLEIPSVKEKTKAHHKVYRQQNLEKVFKNQQKHLYKIQHIYDWQKTPEYKAYLKAHKKGVQNRISRRWIEKPGNRAIHNVRSKRYDDAHREEIRQYGKEYRDTKRQQRTEALNQFYRTHDVPEYLWHKDEFAAEEDFHSALEHVIVSRFGLDIERCFLEEIGRPDIYIPFLDLFLEVKLLSSMWRRDSVAEQSLRYSEIEYTIIVSLDGEPAYWTEAPPVPWMNPEELFGFIAEILEPDK